MTTEPHSWWRKLLGLKPFRVIDGLRIDDSTPFGGEIIKAHWEWKRS